MAVSKRVRYEVLRRDGHRCYYCGATAQDAKLTVDHVIPKALGGSDDPNNLVTACEPCNSGKTSSSPDAQLVAAVDTTAAKFAVALKAAATEMLADEEARGAAHRTFDKWWREWRLNGQPLPRPTTWRTSVDSFLAAGLPLPVLRSCIEKAISRDKVPADSRFRYMCGIAWARVRELHKAASAEFDGGSAEEDDDEYGTYESAGDLATDLLFILDSEDVDAARESAREWHDNGLGTPAATDCEITTSAVFALVRLRRSLERALDGLAGQVPQHLFVRAVETFTEQQTESGREWSRTERLIFLAEVCRDLADAELLDDLPIEEWRLYRICAENQATYQGLMPEHEGWAGWVAAEMALIVRRRQDGLGWHGPGMCMSGDDNAVGGCVERAEFTVWITPSESSQDIDTARVCARHLERIQAGLAKRTATGEVIVLHQYEPLNGDLAGVPS